MEKFLSLLKDFKPKRQENIALSKPSSSESTSSQCSSIKFSLKWTIANYSQIYNEGHPWKWEICSDFISPPNNELFRFSLDLYPKDISESLKDYVVISLSAWDIPQIYNGKIKCEWNVSMEDENGDKHNTREITSYFLYNTQFKARAFVYYKQLLNCASKYLLQNQLTLHLSIHLQADDPIFNVITNNELVTSRFDCANKVTRLVHTWTVENFGELFESSDATPYFIQSDHFPAFNEQSEQFCLRLYPNGLSGENKDNVDIGIRNDNVNSATVNRRMSILDVDGEECYTQELADKIKAKNGKYFRLNRDYLLHNSNGFVHNNQLRIHCEMSYMMDSIESTETVNQTKNSDFVHKSESITDLTKKAIHFVSYQWTIHKFSALCLNTKTNHFIDSQIFKPLTDTRFAFYLRLFPKIYDNQNNKEYVTLDLYNASLNFNQVTVQYRISILGKNGNKWTRWYNHSTILKHDKIRNSKFISQSILSDPRVINNYLTDDKLTILCELWVIQDRKIYKTKPTNTQSFVNNPSSSATVNMTNANLQGAIVNVNGALNIKDLNSNYSNDKK